MTNRSVTIIDRGRDVVAMADVELIGGHYSGRVDLNRMSPTLRRLFEEYEDVVNGQVFSLLDQVEDQIAALSLSAVFDEGCEASVEDLQIFPEEGTISFRVAEPIEANRNLKVSPTR